MYIKTAIYNCINNQLIYNILRLEKKMGYANQNISNINTTLSYQPMPFFIDIEERNRSSHKKLDLNLYCIKHPQQTCFIQVNNPNLLAWNIEQGDILIVEKQNYLSMNDLVVLDLNNQFQIYEFMMHENNEFIFFPLDNKVHSIRTSNWQTLPIIGTVTNTIHQIKPKENQIKFAA